MSQICCTSTGMKDCQLHCHLQTWKKVILNPKSYRPISLQSCFGKLLETIVAKRLSQTALMCGATHPSQMGAQPENSAIDALLRTITPIANSISRKKTSNQKPTWPADLTNDIEGAFNQVHPTTLYEIMCQRRMPSNLVEWVVAFNTDWKIAFGFNQQSKEPQPYRCFYHSGHRSRQSSSLSTVMQYSRNSITLLTPSTPPMWTTSAWYSCHIQSPKPTYISRSEPNNTWRMVPYSDSAL